MIRISDIKLGLDDTESDLRKKVMKTLGAQNVKSFAIAKKSIDARHKPEIYYVYSVDVETDNEEKLVKKCKNAQIIEKKPYKFPKHSAGDKRVVIAGTGPAGLMCGLTLAQNGFKVVLLERGKCVEDRKKDVDCFWEMGALNPDSNVQFGEGGAGTFSDGKLTTGINDFRIQKVLEEFYSHGAPKEILYSAKPHIGTDNLYGMVRSIREDIIRLGGEVCFLNKLVNIRTEDGKVRAAVVSDENKNKYEIETENIVLAIGHSARDTFEMLRDRNIAMEPKSFSVGVRIEHFQEMINKSQYGKSHKRLGAADYKLSVHLGSGRGVYTFCMCPGGTVTASASEEGGVVTNGMSSFAHDGKNANSALLVGVTPNDFSSSDPLAGMYFQKEIEKRAFELCGSNYSAPCQRVGDFLGVECTGAKVEPTYRPGVVWTSMDKVFPEFIVTALREALPLMGSKLQGFADAGAVMTAPETRSSSPVRLVRDKKTMQSNIKGLYPCGEGAGYAGGIMSAAVDGIKIAEMIAVNASKQ